MQGKENKIQLSYGGNDIEVLIKLIVACYLNPLSTFKINVTNKDLLKELVNKKTEIGALEFVNVEKDEINYETSMTIKNPFSLFKIMRGLNSNSWRD